MPLANFPVKSRTPNRATEFKLPPQQAKREHRGARVYQLKSPIIPKPESAVVYDRPAPILTLPGLPSSPVTLDLPKNDSGFASKVMKTGKQWFGQIKVPFVKDPLTPKIPPTPKTADWQNETWANEATTPHTASKSKFGSLQKKNAIRHKRKPSDESEEWSKDPPPLYSKHPEEGGRKAWMTVAGAFLVQFCTVGYLFTWTIFEDFYAHHFLTDQNPIAIRFIGSFQWFLAFFLALVGGKLSDIGYFAHVVIGGSVLFISSLFLLSIVGEEQFGLIFACQSLGMGIGIGLLFVPTATIVTRYFSRKKGLAIGIAMSGGPFGGMILTAILRSSIFSRGLGSSVRITAYLIAPLLVIGYVLMMKPPVEQKPVLPVPKLDIAKYSREMQYLAAAGGTFLGLLFVCYPAFYLELIGLDSDVHFMVARNATIVVGLTGVIGSVLFGFASDKVGVWNMLVLVNGFLAIFLFGMSTIRNQGGLFAFAMFYGIFLASWFSLTVTALASFATRTRETGTRVGLVFSIASFACILAAFLQNALLGDDLLWGRMSALAGVIFLVVMGLAIFSRMTVAAKQSGRKRKFLAGIHYLQIV
jgi:MFS family permease